MRDVIVVGGGPGGTACATLLARRGIDVLLLERERFPRFKIGESLLPFSLDVLGRLGITPDALVQAGFVVKRRAEFLDARSGRRRVFEFARGLDPDHAFAFQVERGPFDQLLLANARQAGVEAREGCLVSSVTAHDDRVEVGLVGAAPVAARFLVDSSGQSTLVGRGPVKKDNPDLDRAAVFTHYGDVQLDPGLAEGNIRIVVDGRGWFWLIPLRGKLSVGAVIPPEELRERGKDAAFADRVARCPEVQALLSTGRQLMDVRAVASWSYLVDVAAGPRHVLVGDALGFVDPIFSTGVHLALSAAEAASETLAAALLAGRTPRPDEFVPYAARMRVAHDIVTRLVLAFYDGGLVKNVFFDPEPEEALSRGITSLLAGGFWDEANPFRRMLLAARARTRTSVPIA